MWILGFPWTASLAKAKRGILGSMRDPISKTKAEMLLMLMGDLPLPKQNLGEVGWGLGKEQGEDKGG